MGQLRTFVAVDISAALRSAARRVVAKLAATGAQYNWVTEPNFHLTLNFFGDVNEQEIPELCRAVQSRVESHEPFFVTISGIGAFPDTSRPRVIWLGVTDGWDELTEINADIADLMAEWGFPKDRNDYRPHLTLGRVRRGGRWNERLLDELSKMHSHDLGGCQVSEVVVYSSHLDRMGPTYTAMSRIRLQGIHS